MCSSSCSVVMPSFDSLSMSSGTPPSPLAAGGVRAALSVGRAVAGVVVNVPPTSSSSVARSTDAKRARSTLPILRHFIIVRRRYGVSAAPNERFIARDECRATPDMVCAGRCTHHVCRTSDGCTRDLGFRRAISGGVSCRRLVFGVSGVSAVCAPLTAALCAMQSVW